MVPPREHLSFPRRCRYAAQVSTALVGATFLFDAVVGVFMTDQTERMNSFRPGFVFAAACSLSSSLLLIAALQYQRASLLLLGAALFTVGVQITLQLATALVTTLSMVAPERAQSLDAAMLLSMNLSGVLGALTIWLAPINPGRNNLDAPSRLWLWLDDSLPGGWRERAFTFSGEWIKQLAAGWDRLGLGEFAPPVAPPGIDLTAIYAHLVLRHTSVGCAVVGRRPAALLRLACSHTVSA